MDQFELAAYSVLTFDQRCQFWRDNPDRLEKQIRRWKRKQGIKIKVDENGRKLDGQDKAEEQEHAS